MKALTKIMGCKKLTYWRETEIPILRNSDFEDTAFLRVVKFASSDFFGVSCYDYGARYYDPNKSIFLGVDPLAEKYPNISSFASCSNNPIMLIDPDGRETLPLDKDTKIPDGGMIGEVIITPSKDDNNTNNKENGSSLAARFGHWADDIVTTNNIIPYEPENPNAEDRFIRKHFSQEIIEQFKESLGSIINGIPAIPIIHDSEAKISKNKRKTFSTKKNAKRNREIDKRGQTKGKYKNWIKVRDEGGYRVFQDKSGDSALFINPYNDPILMVPYRRNKDGSVKLRKIVPQ